VSATVEFLPVLNYSPAHVLTFPKGPEPEVNTVSSKRITEILLQRRPNDSKALEALLPAVYNELRRLARYHLRQKRPNHTLQTTALVHEAYLRLAQEKSLTVENRSHLLGIAAQLMRWILVDYERSRRAEKRGAGATQLALDSNFDAPQPGSPNVDLLMLDKALDRLAKLDRQQSQIIELRYFGGLSIEDTSEVLGISPATVKRSWASARAWLLREMGPAELPR
jgi:RNA polymerase sigma factor (TIGR02999 family)